MIGQAKTDGSTADSITETSSSDDTSSVPESITRDDPVTDSEAQSEIEDGSSENSIAEADTIAITAPEYKTGFYSPESAIVWPWEYLAENERYTETELGGTVYTAANCNVTDTQLIGRSLGNCTASGYDMYDDTRHSAEFEAFEISGIDTDKEIALLIGEEYYVYKKEAYDPPSDLGELIGEYSLDSNLRFDRYSEYEEYTETESRVLTDGGGIWDILKNYTAAPFVQDDEWSCSGRRYLCFTVNSETLGAGNRALYITDDGYLWTNCFDYQYLFMIGNEAAAEIRQYCLENSDTAEPVPDKVILGGIVTEITDDRICFDDTELCSDPSDGRTYILPTDDIRIRRSAVFPQAMQVGDTVAVSCSGIISADGSNTIQQAYNLTKASIGTSGETEYIMIEE